MRISGYPVNPIAVAGSLSLEVRFERLDSVEGMLIRGPKSGYVIVSRDAIRPRANFTIAHEIGHFVMHKGGKYICSIGDIESLSYDKSEESEASVFASELSPHTCSRRRRHRRVIDELFSVGQEVRRVAHLRIH